MPLDPNLKNLFVTGPMAANMQALLANYYGLSGDMRTILEGVVDNVSDHTAVRYVQGALMDRPNVNPMDWYSEEAEVADVTIACMGISQLMEGEEGEAIASPTYGDRDYINLPPHQIEFLKLLRSKAKNLVVVVTGGSAISSPELHEMADAILYAWYPGEQGGQAVADLIFGKESPSAKLPVTFVQNLEDLPPYDDYNMHGRTYRYITQEPLYPFGFGMNYGDVNLSNISASSSGIKEGEEFEMKIKLSNSSSRGVEEVVQLYITYNGNQIDPTNFELKDFKRVDIPANSEIEVTFNLSKRTLSVYDEHGNQKFRKGNYKIHVGVSSPSTRSVDLGMPPHLSYSIIAK